MRSEQVSRRWVFRKQWQLPTARSARYASGLGVLDFMKRSSILKLDAESLAALGPAAMALAEAEGLDAHRRSVAIRLNPRN